MIEPRFEYFLKEQLATQNVPHSGRSLFAHLAGTHDLLEAWGSPPPVRVAGLFHSIYGTWQFRHKSFPIADRSVIRDLIGEEAEALVYLFCVTKRPRVFLANAAAAEVRLTDHNTGKMIEISTGCLDRLLEIEAANLIEQRGAIRPMLTELLATRISAAAKRGITDYLQAA